MEKFKRGKITNIALGIFIVEAVLLIASYFIREFGILNEFGIVKTQTQAILLTTLGIIYLVMIFGMILWYEWAMYGVLSVRISISVLFLIGTSLHIGVIIYQLAMLLLTVVTIFKLLDTKFRSLKY